MASRVLPALGAVGILALTSAGQVPASVVRVKVLIVPSIQTVVQAESLPDGSVLGSQTGGEVTASFPDGVVLVRGGGGDFSDDALRERIRAAVVFPSPSPRGVGIKVLGSYSFRLRAGTSGSSDIDGPNLRRRLRISSLAPGNGSILRIRFDAGKAEEAELPTLLELTTAVGELETLLIGFPDHQEGRRGNVYFLAVRKSAG